MPTSSSFSRAENSLTSPISSTTEGAFSPSEEKSKSSEIVLDSCTLAQGTVEGTSKKIQSPTTDDSKDIVKEAPENNLVAAKEPADDDKTKEEPLQEITKEKSHSEITTKVIEESSSTLEVSETHTSKVEESKITLEQTVTVSETSSEKVIEL